MLRLHKLSWARLIGIAALLSLLICGLGCKGAKGGAAAPTPEILLALPASAAAPAAQTTPAPGNETASATSALRYIFLFIGDGMGPNQVRCVDDALTVQGAAPLSFAAFPVRGEAVTKNVRGKVTDSAAAATAIATGRKTENGMLGKLPDGARVASIAAELHGEGYGVGILTTVSLDHATPAAFFAHSDARTSYDEIAVDLFISGYEYFAGGGFHDGADVAALAQEFHYTLAKGDAEADAAPMDARMVLVGDALTSDRFLSPAADHSTERDGQLARNVARGISRLSPNPKGFFMMTEGGYIDYACHNHDAGAMYWEVMDFDLAVRQALDFYEQHPDETLIVVTADHETGDLQLSDGARGALAQQTVSCRSFDAQNVARFKAEKTDFDAALPELSTAFGLTELTEDERAYLNKAYRYTRTGKLTNAQVEARYGVYSPVTSAAANLVAARAGLSYHSYGHSGVNVPVFAIGIGAETFAGTYENTAIHDKILALIAQYGV